MSPFHFYVAWLFMGFMARFFYQRIVRTNVIVLVPLYYACLLFFGFVFVAGIVVVFAK